MNTKHEARVIQKRFLNHMDASEIRSMQALCENADSIALKLELEYKLADAQSRRNEGDSPEINEFLYILDGRLVGYLGICGFGGDNGPLELTGMVHPAYRNQGVFRTLSSLAIVECRRRNAASVLGLCDRNAAIGQALLKRKNAPLHHSEYEMVLLKREARPTEAQLRGVVLRKAINADAAEIARQDHIYFGEEFAEADESIKDDPKRLPEDEEQRGFTIYLAVKDEKIIGKVNLQLSGSTGGIYGLGVLPEERGKGYGRAILLLAVQLLQEANAETIYLQVLTDNEKALSLYQSCGFETSSVMDYFTLQL